VTIHRLPGSEYTPEAVLEKAQEYVNSESVIFVLIRNKEGESSQFITLSSKFNTVDISLAATTMQAYAMTHLMFNEEIEDV
jgi:hypothetical protein